jgi:glycerophosphoryl diester phosphodiesterase
LLAALAAAGWTTADAPVFIQSFEVDNLKALREQTGVRLVQLMATGASADGYDYGDMRTAIGLAKVANYADAIGPDRSLIIPRDAAGVLGAPTTLVADAHYAGLDVHPWTFRPENYFLAAQFRQGDSPVARGDAVGEIRLYLETGIDGLFSDSPAAAAAAMGQGQ